MLLQPSTPWRPTWTPPAFPHVEEALNAECTVAYENGQWRIYLDVLLASGSAPRHHVSTQYTETRAYQAARIIEKTVRRRIPSPPPTRLPDIPHLDTTNFHTFTWKPTGKPYPHPGEWYSLGRFT